MMRFRFEILAVLLSFSAIATARDSGGASPATSVAAGRAADLDIVARNYLAVDQSYSEAARTRANALLAALRHDAARLSSAQFELRLAELAATADNGHTTVEAPVWPARYNRVPITLAVFADGLYLAAAEGELHGLVGSRVESVEGLSLDALRQRWHRYQAAQQGFRDEYLPIFLESPEILHAAGIARNARELRIRLNHNGRSETHIIRAGAPQGSTEPEFNAPQWLLNLSRAIPDADKPLYLRSPDALFQLVPLPEHEAYYLQFRSNRGQSVAAFAPQALATLREARPRNIILDERLNSGGNLGATRELMEALADIIGPQGHLYILVSGRTFSAGIASVGYAKQAAGGRATIIGSPVGDRLEFWSEGSPITLAFSHVVIQPSPKRHNYASPCTQADCHHYMQLHPIRVGSLAPGIRIGLTYAAFAAERDPLLEAAFALIRPANAAR